MVNERTADATPFHCQVHHQYELPEARAYSASFDEATKGEIEQLPEVAAVEPVQLYRHCAIQTQNNAPWGLARVSNAGRASRPYTFRYRDEANGQGVMAYVIDTGINDQHEQFEGRAVRGPKYVTEPVRGTTTDANDNQGHGTHCAGTIASRDYGIAKKATVVGVKVFNDLPETNPKAGATNADIMAALEWVVAEYRRHGKPSVVNLSLGGGINDALDATVAATVRAGVVVCCAAGNAGTGQPPEDVATTSPARTSLAVTVAAANVSDSIANFSYYGSLVDIIAPGVDILSTWIGSRSATETLDGTSMACPHVVGAISCILSDPNVVDKSPFNVISDLLILADKNRVAGLTGRKMRTVDAVLQIL